MINRRWLILALFVAVSCTSSETDRLITGLPSASLAEPDLLTAVPVPQLTADEEAWLRRIRNRKTSAAVNVARITPGASAQLVAGRAVSLQLTPDLRVTAVGNRVRRRAASSIRSPTRPWCSARSAPARSCRWRPPRGPASSARPSRTCDHTPRAATRSKQTRLG